MFELKVQPSSAILFFVRIGNFWFENVLNVFLFRGIPNPMWIKFINFIHEIDENWFQNMDYTSSIIQISTTTFYASSFKNLLQHVSHKKHDRMLDLNSNSKYNSIRDTVFCKNLGFLVETKCFYIFDTNLRSRMFLTSFYFMGCQMTCFTQKTWQDARFKMKCFFNKLK